jgi:glycosyltransferase involved in cell wall biosynthesis
MACGTPVIAFNRGSVPEVIDHGVTGFIVDDEAGAAAAVERLDELDRTQVRETFDRRFTSRRMAEDYVELYEELCEPQRPLLRAVGD